MVAEYAGTLKQYRVTTVRGDRYAGEWVAEQFRKNGINYEPSERSKSDIYTDAVSVINSGAVALLDNNRIVSQLVGLERRTRPGGRDLIDHAPGGHDDLANAVCGASTSSDMGGDARFGRKLEYKSHGIV